jgi:hypothetical protein
LQYDGLYTIGDEDDDCKDEKGPMSEQDSDMDIDASIGETHDVVEEERERKFEWGMPRSIPQVLLG